MATLPSTVRPRGFAQPYEQWKEDRQAYLDSRSSWQVMKDTIAFEKYNSDKAYYSLAADIKERQDSKVPVAGAGAVEFFSIGAALTKPLTRTGWPGVYVNALFKMGEQYFRYRSGID